VAANRAEPSRGLKPFEGTLWPVRTAEHDAALAAARAALGEEEFDRAWAEGEAMTLEQAVEHALRG
jgi:hypothetical protein